MGKVLMYTAVGLCVSSVLFDVIGFPTPYWTKVGSGNSGLFQTCFKDTCINIPEAYKPDKLKATAAMAILGFLLGLACAVLTVCYVFVESLAIKTVKIVCVILAFLAALFTLVAVMIYGTEYKSDLGWSFFLVTISGLLYIATGIVFVVDVYSN